jgi:hypothetical protein
MEYFRNLIGLLPKEFFLWKFFLIPKEGFRSELFEYRGVISTRTSVISTLTSVT